MSGYLGVRSAVGVLTTRGLFTPGTSLWQITFKPADMPQSDYEAFHGSIRGPGGYFLVFIDNDQYGVGQNGTVDEYAPSGAAMYLRQGQTITLNWSVGSGTAPKAWLYLRQPEVGRI
jgi:hypothetical protein